MRNKSHQPREKNEFEIKNYFLEKKKIKGRKKNNFVIMRYHC